MRFAANLTWLFTEHDLLDRPAHAAKAGFDAVEVLFPYDTQAETLADAIEAAGLDLVLINTPSCDSKGRAALPDQTDAFAVDFDRAATYARAAGSPMLHIMSGVTESSRARETLVANLRWAAAEAPDLTLTVEPLNPRDVPGYFLNDFLQAAALVAEVDAPNLRLQFDSYHASMIHGDACKVWRAVRRTVAHVQIAAAPDRSEPDAATMDVLTCLKDDGYIGAVSAEYGPRDTTEAGLSWLSIAREIAARSS